MSKYVGREEQQSNANNDEQAEAEGFGENKGQVIMHERTGLKRFAASN